MEFKNKQNEFSEMKNIITENENSMEMLKRHFFRIAKETFLNWRINDVATTEKERPLTYTYKTHT